jgi:hypothetical protein
MFSRSRRTLTAGLVVVFVLLGCAPRAVAQSDDRVYQYRNREGREVFTNAGRLSVGGQSLEALALPALSSLDFQSVSPTQLQQLDRGVQRAHEQLQAGDRCASIRASLRVPTSTFVWRAHLRELSVGSLLLVLALLVLAVWNGRLRALMPLAPLLGSLYLAYATYERIDRRLEVLRDGLRACSTELPQAAGASPESVKVRLATAATVQASIDRAYELRAATIDQAVR